MKAQIIALIALVLTPTLMLDGQFGLMSRAKPIDIRAAEIWSAAKAVFSRCNQPTASQSELMARVLVSIEIDRTGTLERVLEDNAVRIALAARLPLPDFSLGIAQIRLSTLEGLEGERFVSKQGVEELLDDCQSLKLVRRLVREYQRGCHSLGSLSCQLAVAQRFNGHKSIHHSNIAYLMILEAIYRQAAQQGHVMAPMPGQTRIRLSS